MLNQKFGLKRSVFENYLLKLTRVAAQCPPYNAMDITGHPVNLSQQSLDLSRKVQN